MVKVSHEVLLEGVVGIDGLYKFSSINLCSSSPKTTSNTVCSRSFFSSVNSTFVSTSHTTMLHFRPYTNHKLDSKSQECIFLCYFISHKGYKCLAFSGRLYISKDVLFNESTFPYLELFQSPTPTITHNSSSGVSLSPLPCFPHSHSDSTLKPSSATTQNVSSNPTVGANSPSESFNHVRVSTNAHTESPTTFTTPSSSDVGTSSQATLSHSLGSCSTQSMSHDESDSSINSESTTQVVIPPKVVPVDVIPVNNHAM
ncbi:hypothetical protein KIW84_025194 [Lathyrus oleraceus]|uniref:Retroviral polymerase SH3-like domain-containing protein n=1 Tax=Pisum sativum TaxID=3888 RepID=A0A9D4YII4_PEA|nr:hypothetical protein KIW84_025194 [Pisum sativum]